MANKENGAAFNRSRRESEMELTAGGAQYVEDEGAMRPRVEATGEQVEASREEMERDLASRAEAAKESTAKISLESAEDTKQRLDEIAERTARIKKELGQIELAVDLKNENYVSREDRARINQQREREREKALNPGGIPPRAAKYHANTRLPSTAPAPAKKKGFFSGFFGGN